MQSQKYIHVYLFLLSPITQAPCADRGRLSPRDSFLCVRSSLCYRLASNKLEMESAEANQDREAVQVSWIQRWKVCTTRGLLHSKKILFGRLWVTSCCRFQGITLMEFHSPGWRGAASPRGSVAAKLEGVCKRLSIIRYAFERVIFPRLRGWGSSKQASGLFFPEIFSRTFALLPRSPSLIIRPGLRWLLTIESLRWMITRIN